MILLTDSDIPIEDFERKLRKEENGGIVLFLGEPRKSAADGPVVAIRYTAYNEMAEKEMKKIENEAKVLFGLEDIIIAHRLGRVPLKTISFFVGVSGAHRKECFDACKWIVDQIKLKVPIWKEIEYERSGNCK